MNKVIRKFKSGGNEPFIAATSTVPSVEDRLRSKANDGTQTLGINPPRLFKRIATLKAYMGVLWRNPVSSFRARFSSCDPFRGGGRRGLMRLRAPSPKSP